MDRNAPVSGSNEQESIGSLLSGLIGELQQLIRGEVALAKAVLAALAGRSHLRASAITPDRPFGIERDADDRAYHHRRHGYCRHRH
jgi:hypothetical protein